MNLRPLSFEKRRYIAGIDWESSQCVHLPPRQAKEIAPGIYALSKPLQPKNLALRFAALTVQNPSAFEKFVLEYGLLGIKEIPASAWDSPSYDLNNEVFVESLDIWLIHIEKVKLLLKLYRLLRKIQNGTSQPKDLEKILICKTEYQERYLTKVIYNEHKEPSFIHTNTKIPTGFFAILWTHNREDAGVVIQQSPDIKEGFAPDIESVFRVLVTTIGRYLKSGISLSCTKVIPSKFTATGFDLAEKRYTTILLVAIFYDLLLLIISGAPLEICAYEKCCEFFLPERKTGAYHSPACRQAAYRDRRKAASLAPKK